VTLPVRLQALVEMTPDVVTAADIGSGHGALAVALAARGVRVVATERGVDAMAVLEQEVRLRGGGVELRDGDGLEPLAPGEAELVVIAGMGGRSILRILERAPWRPKWLLLQPMQDAGLVERWIETNNGGAAARPISQGGRWYHAWLVPTG
jgi:tRNA (adenine22-N1)-methyltransferase